MDRAEVDTSKFATVRRVFWQNFVLNNRHGTVKAFTFESTPNLTKTN